MFGKPEWFTEKKVGWGITPVTWRGWVYAAAWLAVIALPFLGLLVQGLVAESLVWLAASLGTITWDVRSIRRAMKVDNDSDLLYIDENETLSEQFATRHYDFRVRA